MGQLLNSFHLSELSWIILEIQFFFSSVKTSTQVLYLPFVHLEFSIGISCLCIDTKLPQPIHGWIIVNYVCDIVIWFTLGHIANSQRHLFALSTVECRNRIRSAWLWQLAKRKSEKKAMSSTEVKRKQFVHSTHISYANMHSIHVWIIYENNNNSSSNDGYHRNMF